MKQVETFLEAVKVKVDSLYESTLIVEGGQFDKVDPSYYNNTQIVTVVSPIDETEYVIEGVNIDEEALVKKWANRFVELGEDVDAFWLELEEGKLDPAAKKKVKPTPDAAYLKELKEDLEAATLAKKLEIFEELAEAHLSNCTDYARKQNGGLTDAELEARCITLEAGKNLTAVLIAEQLTK